MLFLQVKYKQFKSNLAALLSNIFQSSISYQLLLTNLINEMIVGGMVVHYSDRHMRLFRSTIMRPTNTSKVQLVF